MTEIVLITGGAGFIGAHVARELLAHGYSVRALDSLAPQVHGTDRRRPGHLPSEVHLTVGDVRYSEAMIRALRGVDAVIHLAAVVGVGQSMYQIAEYASVNNYGTAVLLETLSARPVEKLIAASSMSIYGEGSYVDEEGSPRQGYDRPLEHLIAELQGEWPRISLNDWQTVVQRGLPVPRELVESGGFHAVLAH